MGGGTRSWETRTQGGRCQGENECTDLERHPSILVEWIDVWVHLCFFNIHLSVVIGFKETFVYEYIYIYIDKKVVKV